MSCESILKNKFDKLFSLLIQHTLVYYNGQNYRTGRKKSKVTNNKEWRVIIMIINIRIVTTQ